MDIIIWKDYFLSKFRHYLYSTLYNTKIIGNDLSEIEPYLYLSGIEAAYNLDALKAHGITHVINTVSWLDPVYPNDFEYLNLNLRDVPGENIKETFATCEKFINNVIHSDGKVLVHCVFGVSRSSTIVINHLMKSKGMEYQEALDYVKSKRSIVSPNTGFQEQLTEP